MIVFGVQKPQFLDWCIDKSRKMEVNSLVIKNDFEHTIGGLNVTEVSSFVFLPIREGSDLYNCTRLWEDEVKFSVVIFVILFALYVSYKIYIYFSINLHSHRFISLFAFGIIHKNVVSKKNKYTI